MQVHQQENLSLQFDWQAILWRDTTWRKQTGVADLHLKYLYWRSVASWGIKPQLLNLTDLSQQTLRSIDTETFLTINKAKLCVKMRPNIPPSFSLSPAGVLGPDHTGLKLRVFFHHPAASQKQQRTYTGASSNSHCWAPTSLAAVIVGQEFGPSEKLQLHLKSERRGCQIKWHWLCPRAW